MILKQDWTQNAQVGMQNYHDVARLAQLAWASADSAFMRGCLEQTLRHDSHQRGSVIQATLRWALEKLATGSAYQRKSYEALTLRYVERLTVEACAERLNLDETTIKRRQRKGWERLGQLLEAEWEQPTDADKRRALMWQLHYEHCTESERRLLRFLSVFEHPVGMGVELFVDEAVEFHPHLSHLLTRQLVDRNATMQLQIAAALRPIALQYVTSAELVTLHTHIAEYYTEQRDYNRSVEHFQRAGDYEAAAEQVLIQQRELDAVVLDRSIDSFEMRHVSADTWARLKLLAGQRAELSKKFDDAFLAYEAALSARLPLLQARAHYRLGRLYRQQDADATLAHAKLCLRLLSSDNTPQSIYLQIRALLLEAWTFIDQRPDLALAAERLTAITTMITSYVGDGLVQLQCDVANAWASYYSEVGDPAKGLPYRWEARGYARQARDMEQARRIAFNLAWDNLDLEKYDVAEQMFLECQALAQEAQDARMDAACHKGLSACYVLGDKTYGRAIEHSMHAYDYFVSSDNAYWISRTCYDLAEAHVLNGDSVQAQTFLDQGVVLAAETKDDHCLTLFTNLRKQYVEFSDALSADQRQIIAIIRSNGRINKQICVEQLQLSARTASRRLAQLVDLGLIAQQGKGRAAYYTLVES